MSDTSIISGDLFQQKFAFEYEDTSTVKMDYVYLQMVKAFLTEIGKISPHIFGKITCTYQRYKGNIIKGYDDKGGYYHYILEDGEVYESETAI